MTQIQIIIFNSFFLKVFTNSSHYKNLRILLGAEEEELNKNYYFQNITNETTTDNNYENDPGTYLLSWFFIFFFIGLYMICSMKKYPQTEERTDEVWKFMFFSNNGILVASSVNIFNIRNLIIDSSPFALSAICFIIGGVYYLYKYIKTCNYKLADYYFSNDKLNKLFKIPCFIWSLIGLTDPCCRSNSYTVTTYADGHKESTFCCHCMWNCIIFAIKRLATIFSIVAFYIFLIFFILFWFIAKLIYKLIKDNSEDNNNNYEINNNHNIGQVNMFPNTTQNNELPVNIQPNQINNNNQENDLYQYSNVNLPSSENIVNPITNIPNDDNKNYDLNNINKENLRDITELSENEDNKRNEIINNKSENYEDNKLKDKKVEEEENNYLNKEEVEINKIQIQINNENNEEKKSNKSDSSVTNV